MSFPVESPRDETPGRIVTNFCTGVGVHDVITCADLYYDRLRGMGVSGGGQILAFSIDLLRRPYNSRTTVGVCDFGNLALQSSGALSQNATSDF